MARKTGGRRSYLVRRLRGSAVHPVYECLSSAPLRALAKGPSWFRCYLDALIEVLLAGYHGILDKFLEMRVTFLDSPSSTSNYVEVSQKTQIASDNPTPDILFMNQDLHSICKSIGIETVGNVLEISITVKGGDLSAGK